eukprot:jgi/Chrzof1/4199/Cz14g02190.t1
MLPQQKLCLESTSACPYAARHTGFSDLLFSGCSSQLQHSRIFACMYYCQCHVIRYYQQSDLVPKLVMDGRGLMVITLECKKPINAFCYVRMIRAITPWWTLFAFAVGW